MLNTEDRSWCWQQVLERRTRVLLLEPIHETTNYPWTKLVICTSISSVLVFENGGVHYICANAISGGAMKKPYHRTRAVVVMSR